MSGAIQKYEPQAPIVMAVVEGWTQERRELVKRTVCPKGISDDAFALFIEQCRRSGMDPLIKESYCVERRTNIGTKDKPNYVVQHVFQGAEGGFLTRAERFPDYRGCTAGAVYERDSFKMNQAKGEVDHEAEPHKPRGLLKGAWGKVERVGRTPVVVWLNLGGYVQQSPLWSKIPETMIEKCARVAALRKAYPDAFAGVFIPEESGEAEPGHEPAPTRAETVSARLDGTPAAPVEDKPALPAPGPVMEFGAWRGRPVEKLERHEVVAALAYGEVQRADTEKYAKLKPTLRTKFEDSMSALQAALEAMPEEVPPASAEMTNEEKAAAVLAEFEPGSEG